MARLFAAATRAKHTLSTNERASIEIDSLFEDRDFCTSITRSTFESLCVDLLDQCTLVVRQCLQDAGLKREDVHEIVLVGGSSRVPNVQHSIRELFGGKTLCMGLNADEAVACGAAIQAAIAHGDARQVVQDTLLLSALTHSITFGVAWEPSDSRTVALPRGTVTPTKMDLCYKLPRELKDAEKVELQARALTPRLLILFIVCGDCTPVSDSRPSLIAPLCLLVSIRLLKPRAHCTHAHVPCASTMLFDHTVGLHPCNERDSRAQSYCGTAHDLPANSASSCRACV